MKTKLKTSAAKLKLDVERIQKDLEQEGHYPNIEADTLTLLQNLQIHQIELEMQNEELLRLNADFEMAKIKYMNLYEFAPVGYFTLASDSTIHQINLSGAMILGMTRSEIIGKRFDLFTSLDDRPILRDMLFRAFESHTKEILDISLLINSAQRIYLHLEVFCAPGEQELLLTATDITDLTRAERILWESEEINLQFEKEKNEALKKAIEMNDEFLSLMSHELKTPITVINAAIQTMEIVCKDELSNKAKGYMHKIMQNSNRQLKLVNNILENTRISTGHFIINKMNKDIIDLTLTITELVCLIAQRKNIKLSFFSNMKTKVIEIDEELYERILLNLLSNAIKFTPEGNSITIKVSEEIINGKSKVCIQVKDTGIGIPEDKRVMIFDKFGQVDNTFSRQAEGTGIGLYLVKMLTTEMDGEITVESEEGVGSTFTLMLPITKGEKLIEETTGEKSSESLTQAIAIEFSDIYL